jgi:acyl transferase domain-containing protein/acyl carrier protein
MSEPTADLSQVAIIGMAGRFPGAPDVESFWDNLSRGQEDIASLSDEELVASGVDPALLRRENYIKAKGVLAGGDLFDAGFFGYSPREAEVMDPQHRVFLECVWQALEDAGCDPQSFDGRIGLFAGSSLNSYLLFNLARNQAAVASAGEFQTLISNDKDFLTTRVSYKLDLKGPALTVQTACSTSLTAVHLACQSLLNGECDIALAGGVSVTVPLANGYLYERGGIVSPDGHCRAFDASGGGTVAGNGVGVVVLRRLVEARKAGDTVAAVIRATAINNDGAVKVGYTAPSVDGQAAVIAEALEVAGVDAGTIQYVETHGTGTALGDPIEIAALTRAFREHTQEKAFCAIGSVKTNVGHLDAAAGVTGLIKTALALRHRAIPASLNFAEPNPELALDSSPFFVNTELRAWPRGAHPRRAGVSSFGIGGTNVHVILEEAPPVAPRTRPPAQDVHVIPVSGRSPGALGAAATKLAGALRYHADLDLGDVAYTAACRRRAFEYRQAVVGRDREQILSTLDRVARTQTLEAAAEQAPVAFLFPGQGAQYVNMARGLYEREPAFARDLDRCAELFAPHLGLDLRDELFAPPQREPDAARRLEQTALTQPVLFTVEYALARLWSAWGVRPSAMAGHSIGEYVAACLAGVFSLEDAVRLVAARGRLVQAMPTGAMLAVFLPEREAATWLRDGLCLAAVNSTALCVVSGSAQAVDELAALLAASDVAHRRLHTSHAFHSPSMDTAVGPLVEEVRGIALHPPRIPFCSGVTGTWITDEQATSPEYWGAQLRQPVRFADTLDTLLADPALVLLEVGPGETLSGFARRHRAWQHRQTVVGSLRHPKDAREDDEYLRHALGALWTAGVSVDWSRLHEGADRRMVPLPAYPFQRQRYWIDPAPSAGGARPGAVAEAAIDDWFFTPGWRRLPLTGGAADPPGAARWLVLGAEVALGETVARWLETAGADVVRVRAADALRQEGERSWHLDPGDREQYARLLATAASGAQRLRVLHAWSLAARPAAGLDAAALDEAQRLGFDTLVALAQGIGDAKLDVPVAIDVLCRAVFSVTGEEPLAPQNATLLGATTVIPQETAGVTCRTLDVTGAEAGMAPPSAVESIGELLGRDTEDRELALRGRHWWIRDADPVRLPAPAGRPPRLRDGGVYLITGGLGGVGLALAEYIASTVDNPVLGLLGRTAPPTEEDPRLRHLRELGARVVLLTADVTDPAQTGRAVDELRQRYGGLHGVVHAAGLPSQGLIVTKTPEQAAAVLAAKTRGTLVLDQVLRGRGCDFLVLCSSLSALLGGPGQSDYCAANAFLDAYAQSRQREGDLTVCAVDWGTWRGVGMASGLAAALSGSAAGPGPGHPLLQRLVERTGTSRTYATRLSTAEHWILDEHRIMDSGLVPGTAYLEMVRAGVAEQAGGRVVELKDVLFSAPVIVPDGQTREVYTTIAEDGGTTRFAVRSRAAAGGWQEHASGTVDLRERGDQAARDIAAVIAECGRAEVLETEDEFKSRLKLGLVEAGGRIQFTFGPRWRHSLRRIHAGERRLLATLCLDDDFRADLDHYGLHPALMDLAGAAARIHAPDVYYMPLTYRSLEILSGLTSTIHCYIRLGDADTSGETLTCDIDVLDPDGRPLARARDFTIKRINDVDAMLEQIERAAAAPEATPVTPGAAQPGGALATLSAGMSERDAVAAFARILATDPLPAQVAVSTRDLPALRRLARSLTPSLLADEVEQLAPLGGSHPRPDLATPYVAPATETEEAIAAVWREVLGVDRVGVDDDFFELGGHSLAAVQIGTKIKARFAVDLDLRSFFDRPTVAGTAAALAAPGRSAGGAEESIPVLRREEADPALDDLSVLDLDGLSDEEVEARLRELLTTETTERGETT